MVKAYVTPKKDVPRFQKELAALREKMRGNAATDAEIAQFVQKYRGFGSIYDQRPKHMFEKQPLEVEAAWGNVSEKGAKIIDRQMAADGMGFNGC